MYRRLHRSAHYLLYIIQYVTDLPVVRLPETMLIPRTRHRLPPPA